MAKNKAQKAVTKKHLARQDRERRQTRLITGIAIGIIVLVILGIAFGLLNDTLFLNWRSAVSVNGQSLSMHEFQIRTKVARQTLISQYMQYTQLAQMFGMDPSSDPQMSQALNQITSELDTPSTLGGQVIDDMVNDLLIREYAKANGMTVTADDVEKAAQEALRYYVNGTPTSTLTPTKLVYPTLDATQMALITSTPLPTYTETPTLGPTLAATPTNTLVPTATPASSTTNTPIPSPSLTPTPYTFKAYQTQYDTAFKSYSSLGMNTTEFRNIFFEIALYQDRVKAKITENITHQQEQVWARHILVADEATAKDVLSQLNAGADFGTLAAKYSIDTSSKDKGGDVGWFARGKMVMEFEKSAFSMKIGETNQPVKSTYGYHIIQVLGHEARPLTEQEFTDAVNNAFSTWLSQQRTLSKVVIASNWLSYVPTEPTLAQALANDGATATSYVATAQAESAGK